MNQRPQQAISRQAHTWAAAMGTYRFLHNARIEPAMIQQPSFELTRQAIAHDPVTLMIHDMTQLKPVCSVSPTKFLQYTVLAVSGGNVPRIGGLMYQHWFDDPKVPVGETRKQRRSRWTRSMAWPDAVRTLGGCDSSRRWIHVADREADDFQMFEACLKVGDGFVIRSQHDRHLADGRRLREAIGTSGVLGCCVVDVPRRCASGPRGLKRLGCQARAATRARCVLRHARVVVSPPTNDPRDHDALAVSVVQIQQVNVADGQAGIDWILLCSEPVADLNDALKMVGWYRRRWLIEEFHKAQKTGCRLEETQLKSAAAVMRLAAICAVMAVGLLQLRESADAGLAGDDALAKDHFDALWVDVVSGLCGHEDGSTLSLKQFYAEVARQGGYLFRKNDPRPGWQCLWHGLKYINQFVYAIQDFMKRKSCV